MFNMKFACFHYTLLCIFIFLSESFRMDESANTSIPTGENVQEEDQFKAKIADLGNFNVSTTILKSCFQNVNLTC